MNEYIEAKDLYDFRNDIMSEFISLCNYNDYNKITLLRIGETIDRIYEKYYSKPFSDVESKQKWIPVSKRLPTEDDADADYAVLAIHKRSVKRYFHWKSVADNPFDFTYWMPLPEPPEGGCER